MSAGKLPRSVSWRAVTAGYAAGLVGLGALTLRAADEPRAALDHETARKLEVYHYGKVCW